MISTALDMRIKTYNAQIPTKTVMAPSTMKILNDKCAIVDKPLSAYHFQPAIPAAFERPLRIPVLIKPAMAFDRQIPLTRMEIRFPISFRVSKQSQ